VPTDSPSSGDTRIVTQEEEEAEVTHDEELASSTSDAWHRQEEAISQQVRKPGECGKCSFDTKGPCQSMKSGVCYPYMNCAPGSRGGGNHCCPTGTVDCKDVSKEAAILESFKQESTPNYRPLICLVLPILLIFIFICCKKFFAK
jgi:hypothetical protein